jgi:hypothetical protein
MIKGQTPKSRRHPQITNYQTKVKHAYGIVDVYTALFIYLPTALFIQKIMQTEIQQRIKETLGIEASTGWLQACISHLQQQHPPPTIDKCVLQLLNSDLRGVVDRASPSMTLILLQEIMMTSQSESLINLSACSTKQETQANFCLLVQLEEVLDISLNREHRFNPEYQSSNSKRCLKLCVCSGYENPRNAMLAQELSPINNLSAVSLAGLKLLLKGKIVIRNGIFQLHGGNTTVLGGSVEAMVKTQQQALQKARKQAGVGIDPTLRALVSVEDIPDEEQPHDEAHEASADVPLQPMAPPGPAPVAIPPPNRDPPLQQQHHQQQQASTIIAARHVRALPPPRPEQTTTTIIQQAPLDSTTSNDRNPYARRSIASSITVGSSSPPQQEAAAAPVTTMNPYQKSKTASKNATVDSNNSVTTTANSASRSSAIRANPYSRKDKANNISFGNRNNVPNRTPLAEQSRTMTPPATMQPSVPVASITATIPVNTDISPWASDSASALTTPSTTTVMSIQNITFGNLYGLIQDLVQNRQLYETYSSIIFEVAMKQIGAAVYFNIEKNSEFKKNKALGKYLFVNNACFGSGVDSDRVLACKLPHEVTKDCFEKSAAELRALSKSNRAICDPIVKRGGDLVKEKYYMEIRFFKAKLYPTVEQIYHSSGSSFALNNIKNPILILQPDNTVS